MPFEFSEGHNLLMLNAEQGNLEEVRQIIRSKRNLDINQTNKKGYTALAFGVKSGNPGIAQELIAAGADVNIKNTVIISSSDMLHPPLSPYSNQFLTHNCC